MWNNITVNSRWTIKEKILIIIIIFLTISAIIISKTLIDYIQIPPLNITQVNSNFDVEMFCDIFIKDVTSFNSGKALKFNGIPEMPIDNIQISNSVFTAREGGLLSESKDIKLNKVTIRPDSGAAMTVNNVSNAIFSDCTFDSVTPIEYAGDNKGIKVD